jgi:beta-mannosidase
MTVGPWKPISFHTYQNRITDIFVRSQVSESLDVNLKVDFTLSEKAPGFASFILKKTDGTSVVEAIEMPTDTAQCQLAFHFAPGDLQLWYPKGYGEQPLYKVEVQITDTVSTIMSQKPAQLTAYYLAARQYS